MSRGFTDWTDLGIFPLQDVREGVNTGMRMAMVAGRVKRHPDPGENGEMLTEYSREDDMGTLGDIHPWLFWQTSQREKRDMGSWSMAWGVMVTRQASFYNYARVQPLIHRDQVDMVNDIRYKALQPVWQSGLPEQPEGMLAMLMPSTNETEPSKVMLSADRRLVASGTSGPGAAGTTIVDMQPSGVLCMDGSEVPGQGGRHARLHGLLRVVALQSGSAGILRSPDLNSLAINYGTSQQDGIIGYGMVFGPSVVGGGGGGGGGPTTGSSSPPKGPITPGAGGTSGGRSGGRSGGPPPPGSGDGGDGGDGGPSTEEMAVADFGSFQASPRGGHAIGFMSSGASGPVGFGCGKHTIGYDKDGHRMTSAHIMTDSYFYDEGDRDGPLMFEGDYPDAPEEHAIPTVVHLSWDSEEKHNFVGGEQDGKWRWWTTVPYIESEDGDGSGEGEDDGDGGTTGSTPANPAAPNSPNPNGGGGSSTGPITDGGNSQPPPGGGEEDHRGPTRPGGGPITPPGGGSTRPGGGPVTGDAPNSPPQPPNLPPQRPKGPITPVGDSAPGAPAFINSRLQGGHVNQSPTAKFAIDQGGSAYNSRGTKGPDLDPSFPPITTVRRKGRGPAGVISKVGGSAPDRVGLYSILHPFNTGFAAISFRPQLWIKGAPNFEHNPTLGARSYKMEERTRPSVLTIRAWGAQNESGDWDYETTPSKGRARGGTVKGGILIAPAEFEMEDYLGINSDVDTDDTAVSTFVTFAPTVGAAFGKPTTTGRPSQYSKLIRQNTATGKLAFSEFTHATTGVTDIAKMSVLGTQPYMELEGTGAVKVPSGSTGNRPSTGVATGMVRVNTTSSDFEFYDGSAWQNTKMSSGDQDKLDDITVTSAVNLNTMNTAIAAVPADTASRLTALEASAQFQPKAFGRFTTIASPALLATSYNVASVSKTSTGIYAILIDTDMTTANYTVVTSCEDSTATVQIILTSLIATTGFSVALRDASGNLSDASESVSFTVFENNT